VKGDIASPFHMNHLDSPVCKQILGYVQILSPPPPAQGKDRGMLQQKDHVRFKALFPSRGHEIGLELPGVWVIDPGEINA